MFEYYNNTLCVQGNWLASTGVISFANLKHLKREGKIKRARPGKGLGNCALYIYASLPERFKNIIEHDLGVNPYEQKSTIQFSEFLSSDEYAGVYFANYELEDGRYLKEANSDAVEEYTANVAVFNAINKVIVKVTSANPKINKAELWQNIAESVHNISDDLRLRYPFDLPENSQALRAKYEACILEKSNKRYPRTGLEGLIHNNYCNNHSLKISQEVGEWLIAYYSLPIKCSIPELFTAYEQKRSVTGFPRLSESGIQNFIMKPENERIWLRPRDGKDAYINRFGHSIKKNKETLFPNAHWAIDGTKLDTIHIKDNKNKMGADMNIDVVIDVYSEKILGWSLSESETHVDHFKALKMAVNTACAKPYLFTYDAQSGHRTKKMQELYSKVSNSHYHHKVGRKSNPIEQVFNRFQQQVIGKRWFSDKQSIKSKQSRSQVNIDFIKDFKNALPTKDELYKHFIVMVNEWNAMKHPRFNKSRNEVFATHSEHTQELDAFEQISMFWLEESKPKLYKREGMKLTVSGADYDFEVYDKDNQIDEVFRQKYVNTKLIVNYDPEYLDQYVKLYELNEKGQKVFVAYAQKKREHSQMMKFSTEDSKAQMLKDLAVRDNEMMRDWTKYKEIAERTGITRESLVDEQNAMIVDNWELDAKMIAYGTKEEQIKINKKSLFEQITSN
jgi:transposase InsO family protein